MESTTYLLQTWERLILVKFTAWVKLLQKRHHAILHHLLLHPTAYILWPTTFLFVLSYPALYSLYASTSGVFTGSLSDLNYIKSVDIQPSSDLYSSPDFFLKSIWIQPNLESGLDSRNSSELGLFDVGIGPKESSGALDKKFLLEVFNLQQTLFTNVLQNDERIGKDTVSIHSPLEYWNNDKQLLINDQNPLRTVHYKGSHNSVLGIPFSQYKLFSGIVKVDGLIKSAKALQLCVIYPANVANLVEEVWQSNVHKLNDWDQIIAYDTQTPAHENYQLSYKTCNLFETTLITLAPLIVVAYVLVSLTNIHSVKSRAGLLLAYVVEITLSIFSSATITSYFYRSLDLSQYPVPITLSLILFVSIENMFRLVVAISKTSDELSVGTRMAKAVLSSHPVSTTNVIADILLMVFASPFISPWARQHCVFVALTLTFDHLLHITYFTTVLGIDIRRSELQDLLQRSNKSEQSEDSENNLKPLGSGSILSSLLLTSKYNSSGSHTILAILGQYLLKIKLPLFKSAQTSVIAAFILLVLSLKWTSGVTLNVSSNILSLHSKTHASIDTLWNLSFDFFPSKRVLAAELSKKYFSLFKVTKNPMVVSIINPTVIMSRNLAGSSGQEPIIGLDNGTTFNFDMFYFLEFLSCLLFVASSAPLVLKYSLDKDGINMSAGIDDVTELSSDQQHKSFNSKELNHGHFLDVVRVATSACPFIVSVGMDHKVLVWSPMSNPLPAPTQLPVSGRFLPVTHVVMSPSGALITVFSKCGVVKCWSRFTMSWIWTYQIDELANATPLEAFFRIRTKTTVKRSRALVSGKSKLSKEVQVDNDGSSSDSPTPPPQRPTARRPSFNPAFIHTRSASVDSSYDRGKVPNPKEQMKGKEFLMVLKSGDMLTIDCEDGSLSKVKLTDSTLVCCKKMVTPRVNDRIVGVLSTGSLVVATVINNKWKVRNVKVQTDSYNSGERLVTPAVISRTSSMNQKSIESFQRLRANLPVNVQSSIKFQAEPEPALKDFTGAVIEPVPFVGMFVRAHDLTAELIDVTSGTLLKSMSIGQFKPNTFRVFHPEPSHCRFCGCASVSSFSIAYTELETDTLIMHTFSIDNKAKNSICMRVERDPRETRCLGFASVTEHQHWLSKVEGWCTTDLNLIVGVRQKETQEDEQSDETVYTNSVELIRRSRDLKSRRKKTVRTEKKLSDIWEGWTMTASGQVKYYDIPDGEESGLLIKKLGPVQKFGHKSIVVPFGNIIKILYLGNDNLIEDTDRERERGGSTLRPPRSLSFINRRQKMKLTNYELTHSTNFNDIYEE